MIDVFRTSRIFSKWKPPNPYLIGGTIPYLHQISFTHLPQSRAKLLKRTDDKPVRSDAAANLRKTSRSLEPKYPKTYSRNSICIPSPGKKRAGTPLRKPDPTRKIPANIETTGNTGLDSQFHRIALTLSRPLPVYRKWDINPGDYPSHIRIFLFDTQSDFDRCSRRSDTTRSGHSRRTIPSGSAHHSVKPIFFEIFGPFHPIGICVIHTPDAIRNRRIKSYSFMRMKVGLTKGGWAPQPPAPLDEGRLTGTKIPRKHKVFPVTKGVSQENFSRSRVSSVKSQKNIAFFHTHVCASITQIHFSFNRKIAFRRSESSRFLSEPSAVFFKTALI